MRLFVKAMAVLRNHLWLIVITLVVTLLGFLGFEGYRYLQKINVKPENLLSFFGTPKENLASTGGVTNFLFLGIRGEGSDSPNLSDTMIIASYNHDTDITSMISIPRDLWSPSLMDRINTAYSYGETASPGAGIKFTQATILQDLGIPIDYTAVINFSLFEQAINLVGGITINVDPGFTDPKFPVPGREDAMPESSRYEAVSFATGSAHLSGEMALKFVRSRHSEGDEGTDFARSVRQQQVISALRQKIITPNFLLDQKKANALLDIVNRNLKTNIKSELYPTLAKLALDTKDKAVMTVSLATTPDQNGISILYNPPISKYQGKWVLVPKDDNWNALKQYLKNHLDSQGQAL